jgi:hypothetical protein
MCQINAIMVRANPLWEKYKDYIKTKQKTKAVIATPKEDKMNLV